MKMNIRKLTLHNFRNYSAKKLVFTADKVVFVGDNGRGKTNLLEAISVVSVGKSWREVSGKGFSLSPGFEESRLAKTCNLIQSGSDLSAVIDIKTNLEDSYQVQIFPRKKVFKKNGKQIPRKKQLGEIPSLLFVPEHLEIFSAPKRERQRFFDRFLCQIFPQYKDLLTQTLRIVKQKNIIFREVLSEEELKMQLAPWNEILQKNIPQIWKFRENFLADLEPLLQSELAKISNNKDEIKVFLTRGGMEEREKQVRTPQRPDLSFSLDFSRELQARRCLFSPTRDDFTLYFRSEPVMSTVSRGEIRSILLALLAAQKQYFFSKTGKMPILLLDDCFSELDDNRQQGLERLCERTQAFFTTTHEEHFSKFSGKVQKVVV
jgi:DNA replication and repair protein RecF